MRALFLVFSLSSICATFCPSSPAAAEQIIACAIRWDAWYSNGPNDPAYYMALALSRPEFNALAPLHARFDSAGQIVWEPTQETFDAEIRAAHRANLCWAYLMYGKDNVIDLENSMMLGLNFHRASAIKGLAPYAMMVQSGTIGTSKKSQAAVSAVIRLLKDENYQHVIINGKSRPLLFLYYDPEDLRKYFESDLGEMKNVLDLIRKQAALEQLGNPYIVVLFSGAKKAEALRIGLGVDAISQYVAGRRNNRVESWVEFEPTIEADWNAYAAATEGDVVPTLRSGADIRSLCKTPPPFEHRFSVGDKCDNYVVSPSNHELDSEFRNAATWLDSHVGKDPAALLLLYAWSECSESGNCLMPTLGDPMGQKLDGISAILNTNR